MESADFRGGLSVTKEMYKCGSKWWGGWVRRGRGRCSYSIRAAVMYHASDSIKGTRPTRTAAGDGNSVTYRPQLHRKAANLVHQPLDTPVINAKRGWYLSKILSRLRDATNPTWASSSPSFLKGFHHRTPHFQQKIFNTPQGPTSFFKCLWNPCIFYSFLFVYFCVIYFLF